MSSSPSLRACALLIWASLLAAAPAAAPAPDLSSPKATAKSLFNAINLGDRDGVRAALHAADEPQAELAAAMADLIVAGKKLGDAAKARFGAAGDPIGRGMLDPNSLKKLDDATVDIKGDIATLTVPGQPRPMSFRRHGDGNWRLVVTDFGGAAPENIGRQVKLVRQMGEALDASAREVAGGAHKTPDAALNAIQQRLHGVMLAFYRPSTTRSTTTQASTQAATQAATQASTQPTTSPASMP